MMYARKRFLFAATLLFGFSAMECRTVVSQKEAIESSKGNEWRIELPGLKASDAPLLLVRIPAGTFQMGSLELEQGREENESPRRAVGITKDFYLGKFEVTQAQWTAVTGENPSTELDPNYPVNKVSWEDCQEFLRRLNQIMKTSAFRLPTEAEFEYACRAGTETSTYFGDNPSEETMLEYAWFRNNSDSELHTVGSLKPNAWGLFDILGNVREWCQDWYGPYNDGKQTDPVGPSQGTEKVIRGASWMARPEWIRSADRGKFAPDLRRNTGGLRVAYSE